MTKATMIRQGDILLIPVDTEPPQDTRTQSQVVLAYGELTGHAHRLSGAIHDWTDSDDARYIHSVGIVGELSHEDHDPVPAQVVLPGQTYKVVQQREWTLDGQWQEVVD